MPRAGLNAVRVVEQAAAIADADGLPEVSLARVAQALGVSAPSLYNHVEGLAGLLHLVTLRGLEELADTIRDAAVGRSGADALRAVGQAYRAYAHAHPGRYAATLSPSDPDDGAVITSDARATRVLTAVLLVWGFSGDEALHRVRVARAALHGFVAIEAYGGFGPSPDSDKSFEVMLDMLVAGLEHGQA
jgi:AcrR family transcriptional regulator